eukprot:5147317-Heterocapsa_arctica.AAC.1
MEAGAGWRNLPLGQQGGDGHQAGVGGPQGEVSSDYECRSRNFINEYRFKFSLGRQMTIGLRRMNDYSHQYSAARNQNRLGHNCTLGHLQILLGRIFPRFPNFVNNGKHSRSKPRSDNRSIEQIQKAGRQNIICKINYRIGEASNPGPQQS